MCVGPSVHSIELYVVCVTGRVENIESNHCFYHNHEFCRCRQNPKQVTWSLFRITQTYHVRTVFQLTSRVRVCDKLYQGLYEILHHQIGVTFLYHLQQTRTPDDNGISPVTSPPIIEQNRQTDGDRHCDTKNRIVYLPDETHNSIFLWSDIVVNPNSRRNSSSRDNILW